MILDLVVFMKHYPIVYDKITVQFNGCGIFMVFDDME